MNTQDRIDALHSRRSIELTFDESSVREEGNKRYLTFTAASDRPLVRNMFFGPVRETLDFNGLNTSRLDGGHMKLLDTHNSGRLDDILGNITGYRIKKGGNSQGNVLEVDAEFDMDRPRSKEAFDGVMSRLFTNVSIGYTEDGPGGLEAVWNDERSDYNPKTDVVGDITYRQWEATEISLVPVPADAEIGIGRSAISRIETEYAKHRERMRTRDADATLTPNSDKSEQRSNTMSEDNTKAVEPVGENARDLPVEDIAKAEEIVEEARELAGGIDVSGQAYIAREALDIAKKGVSEDFIRKLAERAAKGMSEADAKSAIFDHISERDKTMNDIKQGQAPAAIVSGQDHQRYSAARHVQMAAGGRVDGIEGELLSEWEGRKSASYKQAEPAFMRTEVGRSGTTLPFALLMEDDAIRAELVKYCRGNDPEVVAMREQLLGSLNRSNPYTVGSSPTGFHQTEFSEDFFIAALVAKAMTLGYCNKWAMELTQDYSGIIETNSMSVSDVNPGAETAARSASTGPSYNPHKLSWHEVYGRLSASVRTFDQSRNFAARLLEVMNRDLMRGVNDRLLNGLTASHQPLGLLAKTGSSVPAVATVSNALTYAKIVELRTTVAKNNGNINDSCVYVTTPEQVGKLYTLGRLTGSTGAAADAVFVPSTGTIDGYTVVQDNNAPKNLASSNNRHGFLFGDLSTVDFVSFSGVSLIRDDLTGLANGNVNFHIRYAYDILPRNVNHFAAMVDLAA